MAVMRYSYLAVTGLLLAVSAAFGQTAPGTAAVVNGSPIMAADVDEKLGATLAKLQEQVFSVRQKQLDMLIDQKLLEQEAAKRGVTIAQMLQAEITSRVTAATPEEISKFYDENKAGLTGDFKTLEEQIKQFLNAQRLKTRQQDFLKSLRTAAKIDMLMTPPPVFRATVATTGASVRGAADAPITIIEFSDFHCPFCKKIQPVLDQVRTTYGDKVKLVFRDFPLDSLHPQASIVSVAARCATEQGKFWEFHDKVFTNAPDGSPVVMDAFAKAIGLDVAAFNTCRSSGKYAAAITSSLQEGARLGITGTPTFFVNGRMLVGAVPFDEFSKVIEAELALVAKQPVASR